MNRRLRAIALFAVVGAVADRVAAGVIIQTQSVDEMTKQRKIQRTIVSGPLVRTEEKRATSIVRPDLGKIWDISSSGAGCREYTVADLALLRSKSVESMRQMLQSMADSAPTPEARTRLLELASQSSFSPPKASYRKIASGERVGRWKCDRYAKEIGGATVSEVCVVPLSSLRLSRNDLSGILEAGAVFGAAPSTWDQETVSLLENAPSIGFDAFPVKIAVIDGSGKPRHTSQLTGIVRSKIPSKVFQSRPGCAPAAPVISREARQD